jgi:alkanesulfonate monooxygenase SsuD/methylene tetrahydromethanopterin reductase-like flavin-dependent oxidoreductase (luciferase family)
MGGGGFETQGHPGEVSMRRAAQLAEGFKLMAPTGGDVDRAIDTARRLHELAAAEGRTIDIEARLLTQLTPSDEWASVVARYRDAGVFTHVGLGNRIVGGTVHDQIALIREVERRVRPEL